MKAKDLLLWFAENISDIEQLGSCHVQIDDDDMYVDGQKDFIETFFGITPDKTVPMGDYIYLYADVVDENALKKISDKADLVLENTTYDEQILLFRIED